MLADEKQELADVEKELSDPKSDYEQAQAEFMAFDKKLETGKKEVEKLLEAMKPEEAKRADAALNKLRKDWEAARDRFNLAIAQRKTLQTKKVVLTSQIEQHEEELERLKGGDVPQPKAKEPDTSKEPPPKAPIPKEGKDGAKEPEKKTPPITLPGIPGMPAIPVPNTPTDEPPKPKKEDAEVNKARTTAESRRGALEEAEANARTADERVRVLEQLISTEEQLAASERKAADQAQTELARLTAQLLTTTPQEFGTLSVRITEAERRLSSSRGRVRTLEERIASLNDNLRSVRQEQIEAMQLIEQKRLEAEAADEELAVLLNPFSTRNIRVWVATHGVNMLLIVCGIFTLHMIVRHSSRQIARYVARNSSRGSDEDRENRANTLVGVFRYVAGILIFGGGVVMLLDEAGVPVVPLMGGAAVIGLAVAFGAQNLIKDYFSGFMMLTEDQYGVNDVVRIGNVSGLVEKITLRVTVLRDLEGALHFVPHGTVSTVSNLTHGWSRALFDIPVPHDADLNRVMGELVAIGKGLRTDPLFAMKLLEDPEMLGVEVLDSTAVVIRFLMKTRPLQQWAVKREMLRRIKSRLEEMGIALPPPNSLVHLRLPEGMSGVERPKADSMPGLVWPEAS